MVAQVLSSAPTDTNTLSDIVVIRSRHLNSFYPENEQPEGIKHMDKAGN